MAQDVEALIADRTSAASPPSHALALAAIVALAKIGDDEPTGAYVAVLDVNGVIETDRDRNDALDRIARDDNAKALLLRINSSDGTFVGGEKSLSEPCPRRRCQAGRRGDGGCRGIGRLYDRHGRRAALCPSGHHHRFDRCDLPDDGGGRLLRHPRHQLRQHQERPAQDQSVAARAHAAWTQVMVDEMQAVFVSIVDEGRPDLGHAAVVALADGRVFSSVRAVENGLVDEFGGDREARDWLAAEHDIATDLPLRDVEIEDDLPLYAEVLLETEKSVLPEPLTLDGMLALWHLEL